MDRYQAEMVSCVYKHYCPILLLLLTFSSDGKCTMQKGSPVWVHTVRLVHFFFRWEVIHPKSLYVLWFQKENCQIQGLPHQGLAWLNWFPPEPRTLPVRVGYEPKTFAKPGAQSCVFLGADTQFIRDRGDAESPYVAWIPKGLFRAKTLITADSAGVLLMAAILLMSRH